MVLVLVLPSCLLCFQLLTFTLMFSGAASPAVVKVSSAPLLASKFSQVVRVQDRFCYAECPAGVSVSLCFQVDPGLSVPSQGEDAFRGQITRDRVLEDSLRLLLPPPTHLQTHLSLGSLRQQVSLCCHSNGKGAVCGP